MLERFRNAALGAARRSYAGDASHFRESHVVGATEPLRCAGARLSVHDTLPGYLLRFALRDDTLRLASRVRLRRREQPLSYASPGQRVAMAQ